MLFPAGERYFQQRIPVEAYEAHIFVTNSLGLALIESRLMGNWWPILEQNSKSI